MCWMLKKQGEVALPISASCWIKFGSEGKVLHRSPMSSHNHPIFIPIPGSEKSFGGIKLAKPKFLNGGEILTFTLAQLSSYILLKSIKNSH